MTYVRVPRAVLAQYHPQPWSALVAAAERGQDGLAIQTPLLFPFPDQRPPDYDPLAQTWDLQKDFAYFRRSDLSWTPDLALLFVQCW